MHPSLPENNEEGCDVGNHLCQSLLEPGGAKHPLQIIESVLGQEIMRPLSSGWGPQPDALLARLQPGDAHV